MKFVNVRDNKNVYADGVHDDTKALQSCIDEVKDGGTVYFKEASLVLKCRKMARYDLSPDGFIDGGIESNYSNGDYHKMFIAEIVETLKAQ